MARSRTAAKRRDDRIRRALHALHLRGGGVEEGRLTVDAETVAPTDLILRVRLDSEQDARAFRRAFGAETKGSVLDRLRDVRAICDILSDAVVTDQIEDDESWHRIATILHHVLGLQSVESRRAHFLEELRRSVHGGGLGLREAAHFIHAMRFADQRLSMVAPRRLVEAIAQAETSGKGGRGNTGVVRIAAELSVECNAFDDQQRGGEPYDAAVMRSQAAFRAARSKFQAGDPTLGPRKGAAARYP